MEKYLYSLVSVILFFVSLMWVVYSIFSTFRTECFDMFKAYVTITVLLTDMIWSNFVRM